MKNNNSIYSMLLCLSVLFLIIFDLNAQTLGFTVAKDGSGDFTSVQAVNVIINSANEVNIIMVGGPDGYEYCSAEGETCQFDVISNIAYGADGKFNYKYNVSGSLGCNSTVWRSHKWYTKIVLCTSCYNTLCYNNFSYIKC